jgi:hypothetical protein
MFEKEPTLTNKHRHKLTNICGGLLSIPIIALLFILFLLKFIQLTTHGIVYSATSTLTSYEPYFTTFTTANHSAYAPFMIAFALNNADTCSAPISLDVNVNLFNGSFGSANRSTTKIPVKL